MVKAPQSFNSLSDHLKFGPRQQKGDLACRTGNEEKRHRWAFLSE